MPSYRAGTAPDWRSVVDRVRCAGAAGYGAGSVRDRGSCLRGGFRTRRRPRNPTRGFSTQEIGEYSTSWVSPQMCARRADGGTRMRPVTGHVQCRSDVCSRWPQHPLGAVLERPPLRRSFASSGEVFAAGRSLAGDRGQPGMRRVQLVRRGRCTVPECIFDGDAYSGVGLCVTQYDRSSLSASWAAPVAQLRFQTRATASRLRGFQSAPRPK
jgi:hypothetical protein